MFAAALIALAAALIALEDTALHGETIRSGDPVALMLASANFDSAKFDRPDLFNVQRAPNDHIAFGSAAHTCLGLHIARLELKVIFEELLRRCGSIALDGPVELVRDNLIHGIRTMPLRVSRGAPRVRKAAPLAKEPLA